MQLTETAGLAITLTLSDSARLVEAGKLPGEVAARQPLSTVADTPNDELMFADPDAFATEPQTRKANVRTERQVFIRSLSTQTRRITRRSFQR